MVSDLSVFVQCPPTLRKGFDVCRKAIEESDIGTDYTLAMHPPGRTTFEHFLEVLDRMADAPTDLVVRLEDDVDVNRHFKHNVLSWPTLHHKDFGIGWLFDPGGNTYSIHDRMYQRAPSHEVWEHSQLAYSLAAVLWRKDVPAVRAHCAKFYAKYGGDAQDLALSETPISLGRRLVRHAPSLVEHMIDLPSTLSHGHNIHATSQGSFFKDWKRGEARVDHYGRVVGL
jgi:hypothetical protein